MKPFLEALHNLDTVQAWGFFGVANLVIFGISVVACWGLGRLFEAYRIFDHWERFSALEGLAALASVGFNTAVSVVPFPRVLARIPLIRWVGTSTFHAEHHERPGYNFGFYSLIWDQLFGTLDPRYWQRYQGAAERRGA